MEERMTINNLIINIDRLYNKYMNDDWKPRMIKGIKDKIKKYESELRYAFYRISEDIGKAFDYKMYGKYNDKEPITDRKEFAEWVQTQPKHYQGKLFRMFNKRNYSELIWKLLKPEFKKL